jgi:hypothetical protein
MEQTLARIQRQLWRLVTAPEDLAGEPGPHALLQGSAELTAADRLSVYANAYFARLHDALRDDFPALARALGADAFHDLVKTYLMVHPPGRPSLREAGAALPGHLAADPFAAIFAGCCAYAADLAVLELAIVEVFYAPDARAVARAELAAVAPDRWPALRFALAPALRIVRCDWPVHEIRERFDREEDGAAWAAAPALAPEPTALRVFRTGERVRYRAMPRDEHDALAAAAAGETFAAICERVTGAVGEADAARRSAELLGAWVADGLIAELAD